MVKFKQLLNEYRSYFYELQYIEEVLKDSNEEFEIYYRQYCAEKDIDIAGLNKTHAKRVEDVFSTESLSHAITRKFSNRIRFFMKSRKDPLKSKKPYFTIGHLRKVPRVWFSHIQKNFIIR